MPTITIEHNPSARSRLRITVDGLSVADVPATREDNKRALANESKENQVEETRMREHVLLKAVEAASTKAAHSGGSTPVEAAEQVVAAYLAAKRALTEPAPAGAPAA